MTPGAFSLEHYYDAYPRVEGAIQAALDESLQPRGPDLLYDLAAGLGLSASATILDLGCGEGQHSLRLAQRLGCQLVGIDPVPRHVELACAALAASPVKRVRFEPGAAESIPLKNASVDLVWCREVLVHVPDLARAFAECRRVLRPDGRMLAYHTFATDRLEPGEAAWLFAVAGVVPANARPAHFETAVRAAGLRIEQRIEVGSEWGERAEEQSGHGTWQLLHAARLLRAPERYVAQFGAANVDIALADALWHVYRLIGKLSPRAYLLARAEGSIASP